MPVLTKEFVPILVKTGASARIEVERIARFRVGDWVRVKNINPTTHTRMPRYVRGKLGRVQLDHGVFLTPDTVAHGLGEHPQHLYNVSFSATELWGETAPAQDSLRIDLWDDYLEIAEHE
jgi:nitrile hydratase